MVDHPARPRPASALALAMSPAAVVVVAVLDGLASFAVCLNLAVWQLNA